jgi:iron complex transport system ATP-binding protein
LLRADNVSFAYGAAPVLREVSATFPRGGLLGLLGPNGSGKTTLLRLLSGTRRPTAGRVLLEEVPTTELSHRDLARRIAVVPQETQLTFEYTVLELVLMGRHPHLGLFELEGPADVDAARQALRTTSTAHLESRRFSTLSGGEKQRVVIAAALAQASDILLLDEPTASLDLRSQLEVAGLLTTLNKQGMTIVISTHDLHLAAAICRDLVLLREGQVLEAGPMRDVLTPPAIRELYGVTAEVHANASGHVVVVPIGL